MKIVGPSPTTQVVTAKTKDRPAGNTAYKWWLAKNDKELCDQLLTTAAFLKEGQAYRYRQAAVYARLYGNMSLFSFIGTNSSKLDIATGLPADRPTFNLVQSATDTLVSRISQSRPSPVFLTDNGDYKQRNLAKKLNNFIAGELYQTKAYEKTTVILRDACVEGTGCLKIFETPDNKVGLERVLLTELLMDPNEGMYGEPRQLYQLKLVDRAVLEACFSSKKAAVKDAAQAYPESSADSSKTISDLVMVVEGWHLPSGKDAKDGRHVLACSGGVIFEEEFTKDKFPFVFLHYSPRLLGFWAQGLAEQLMGTQMEINSLLYTLSRAIKLVGVPRVFVEKGSKVSKASFNNEVGSIIEYSGMKPIYEVAPCVAPEMYAQLQRLVQYGFNQVGVSALQASSEKPAGLNSGEAIRSYDDISTDRFATLSKRYDNIFIDLAHGMLDLAKDIAEREGKYGTVYPGKNGVKEIDLPKASMLDNPYVIQVFNQSSLPRDPAGRLAKVTEMAQAGMITLQEARRLLDYPDLNQVELLENASEERIFKILDEIIEDGKYTPPDPFMNRELALKYATQYINLYAGAKLEEERIQLLRNFFTQAMTLQNMAAAPQTVPPQQSGAQPQASPEAPAVSALLPNAPGQA